MDCIYYSAFLVLSTTQSTLQHIHASAAIHNAFSIPHNLKYSNNIIEDCLIPGSSSARDQTIYLLVSGRPSLTPERQLPVEGKEQQNTVYYLFKQMKYFKLNMLYVDTTKWMYDPTQSLFSCLLSPSPANQNNNNNKKR